MVEVFHGDCLVEMRKLIDSGRCVQSIVTDPPYNLESIRKRFGNAASAAAKFGKDGAYLRASRGFMNAQWDSDIAFQPETWRLAFDLLSPGGHLLAFGGSRTEHRLVCAIEDAGFEIRDKILWLFASGFPKSHNVSKAIDKAAGAERERIRGVRSGVVGGVYAQDAWSKEFKDSVLSPEPITADARQWDGWGTALKPAMELICVARKPLAEGTIAANVLAYQYRRVQG